MKPNLTKKQDNCLSHLKNRQPDGKLKIKRQGIVLQNPTYPKYLGVT